MAVFLLWGFSVFPLFFRRLDTAADLQALQLAVVVVLAAFRRPMLHVVLTLASWALFQATVFRLGTGLP